MPIASEPSRRPFQIYDAWGRPWPLDDVLACVGKGWRKLLLYLIRDLFLLGWNAELYQIKEKFGGLRFYIGGGTDAIYARVADAEEESFRICEVCGEPGTRRCDSYWISTRCDTCHAKEHPKV